MVPAIGTGGHFGLCCLLLLLSGSIFRDTLLEGIEMHFCLADPTDFGVQYSICEFDHNPTILLERYDRLTPTCKRRVAELQQKLAAWAIHITKSYEDCHSEKDIFAEVMKAWAAHSPAEPTKQEDKVDATDFQPDAAAATDAHGWFMFFFNFDEEEQAA